MDAPITATTPSAIPKTALAIAGPRMRRFNESESKAMRTTLAWFTR